MKNVEETIKSRHSVRKYTDKPIEEGLVENLNTLINECNKEGNLNIQLVLNDSDTFDKFILHYGKIRNAKNYIALIGKKVEKNLDEKVGYYGEKLVLEAQELGLNTCWVAGTYSKGLVKAKINEDEKLVCIIAIGYGESQGVPHKGKSFDDVSVTKDAPDWYKKGIEYALLAPTAINQQKFKFELINNNIVIAKAGIGPMAKIDLGIVKYHFELGAGKDNFRWKE